MKREPTTLFPLRLTATDRRRLDTIAKAENVSRAEILRRQITPRTADRLEPLRQAIIAFDRVGRNLNQIARTLNHPLKRPGEGILNKLDATLTEVREGSEALQNVFLLEA